MEIGKNKIAESETNILGINISGNLHFYVRVVILTLVALLPLLDVINGAMVHSNVWVGNIGQLTKVLLFALLFVFYLSKKQKTAAIAVFTIAAAIVFSHLPQPLNRALADTLYLSKICFIPVALFGFTNFIKEEQSAPHLPLILAWTWTFYALNAVATVFGFGTTQYQSGGGLKGFFYAGNEFALSFLLQTTLMAFLLIKKKKYVSFVIFALVSLLVAFIIGMKTVMFGIVITLALTFINFVNNELFSLVKKYVGLIAIAVVALLLSGTFILYKQKFFYRIQYHRDNGVISFITSNRDKTAKVALEKYRDFSVKEKLTGIGKVEAEKRVGPSFGVAEKAVEMDPIDLLLVGGIVSVLVVYSIWISAIVTLWPKNRYAAALSLTIFAISTIAGHVLYAGIAIPYLALLFAHLQAKTKKQRIYFIGALSRGGIATYIKQTKQEAKKAGLEITVINTHTESLLKTVLLFPIDILSLLFYAYRGLIADESVIFHYHMATGGSFVRKYVLALIFWPWTDAQILHIHSGKSPAFFNSLSAKKSTKPFLSLFFRLFSKVLVVSKSLSVELKASLQNRRISINEEKWVALPNAIAIPAELDNPLNYDNSSQLKLLFVGRLVDEKDLPTLVDICSELKRRSANVQITIIGDGPLRNWLQVQIKQKNLESIVTYVGWKNHDEVQAIYKQNHGLIITSKQESFGLVVLEAYLHGLFAIATANGGLPDIVINEETGYIEKTQNWKTLVDRIMYLTSNPTTVRKLQTSAQEFVKSFSYAEHIAALESIYSEVNA